jgi:hypothetical protein
MNASDSRLSVSSKALACVAISALTASLAGCPGEVAGLCDGISITIAGSADANSTFTAFTPTQCNVTLEGDMLTIDLLDRGGDPNPRVLISVQVTDGALAEGSIDLTRANDTDLAPAVYQEFTGEDPTDQSLADGPFWSSNSGTLDATTDMDGNLMGSFMFTADNPRPDMPSMATGTVTVSGEGILLLAGAAMDACGACGSGGMMATLAIMVTLGATRLRRRL